jgi:hypothetical protein
MVDKEREFQDFKSLFLTSMEKMQRHIIVSEKTKDSDSNLVLQR